MASLHNTMPGNLLDFCGLTIPVGLDGDGMPIGFQIMAARGTDERLLSTGLAVERACSGRTTLGIQGIGLGGIASEPYSFVYAPLSGYGPLRPSANAR